jgi:serine phosphatase RsbU (regulator of sigma subunit)
VWRPDDRDAKPPTVIGAGKAAPRLTPSQDPREIATQILDGSVPGFADAAAVFMLDCQLAASERTRSADGGCAPEDWEPNGREPDDRELLVRRLGTRFSVGQVGQDDERASAGEGAHDVYPAWGVVTFKAGSPYALCVRHGHPVAFEQPGKTPPSQPRYEDILDLYRSFLVVPMIAGGVLNGLIAFARVPDRNAFVDEEIAVAATLAEQAGVLLADAKRAMEHRQTAEALQRGLLPTGPVISPGLEVVGRCLPAAGNLSGGDWYDVVPLPGGRTGLIVGDVMGHGPSAAAVMAQLRAAAHALAISGLRPVELLPQLDRTAATLGDVVYATCAYAVIDPADTSVTVALAGHLPPVLAMPDGVTRVLELPSGLSLGLGSAAFGQVRIKLPAGTILALFTDGLVETRTRSFEQGIGALRAVLAREHGTLEGLEGMCDVIIHELAAQLEDDTTLVLVRIPVSG